MNKMVAVAVALLVLSFVSCVDKAKDDTITLICKPCDGVGSEMSIVTPTPIPLGVFIAHDICFSRNIGKTFATEAIQDVTQFSACWYGCPGIIEEKYDHGFELCVMGVGGE